MKLFHNMLLIVLATIVATSTAAPLWEDENLENNDEYGEHFEGDMLLTKTQRDAVYGVFDPDSRNGLKNVAKYWPNRTVVYYIEEDDFDEDQVQKIANAIADISNKSCLTFRRRESDDEHAVIIQGSSSGCFSNVGLSSRQVLNLSKGCFRHGTVVHEMLHTLGFYHMQSTYDRDEFVTIVWENIKSGHENNFKKYSKKTVTNFGVPYDYESVMHYTAKAFSTNGNETIIPLKANVTIGQRVGLSESDIIKLNKMYCGEDKDKEVLSLGNNVEVAD